jgi:integrase
MNPNSTGRSRERLKEILPNGDLHTFRHSFASHLEDLGATRWDTKCLLGHKVDDITAQYVKVNVHRLIPLINQL